MARSGGSASDVIALAESQLGKPYVWDTPLTWNTRNPSSFDCSGLTGWCYAQAGVKPRLMHNAQLQYRQLKHRAISSAQPGDLIFYGYGGSSAAIHHVCIYLGGGMVIEAPERGIPVRTRQLDNGNSELIRFAGAFPGSPGIGGFSGITSGIGLGLPDPNSLHPPLNKTVRREILNFIISTMPKESQANARKFLANEGDAQLIQLYKDSYNVSHGKPPPGFGKVPGGGIIGDTGSLISGTTHLIGLLTSGSFWVRAAEFTVGGVILAVGVKAMAKGR